MRWFGGNRSQPPSCLLGASFSMFFARANVIASSTVRNRYVRCCGKPGPQWKQTTLSAGITSTEPQRTRIVTLVDRQAPRKERRHTTLKPPGGSGAAVDALHTPSKNTEKRFAGCIGLAEGGHQRGARLSPARAAPRQHAQQRLNLAWAYQQTAARGGLVAQRMHT